MLETNQFDGLNTSGPVVQSWKKVEHQGAASMVLYRYHRESML